MASSTVSRYIRKLSFSNSVVREGSKSQLKGEVDNALQSYKLHKFLQ